MKRKFTINSINKELLFLYHVEITPKLKGFLPPQDQHHILPRFFDSETRRKWPNPQKKNTDRNLLAGLPEILQGPSFPSISQDGGFFFIVFLYSKLFEFIIKEYQIYVSFFKFEDWLS